MLKNKFLILILSLSIGGCASINSLKISFDSPQNSSAIIERSDYISSAIADWISEDVKTRKSNMIEVSNLDNSNNFDALNTRIIEKLQKNGINIAAKNDKADAQLKYLISEIDDKILIQIQTNNKTVSRLFAKGDNFSIIPASPLSIRIIQ